VQDHLLIECLWRTIILPFSVPNLRYGIRVNIFWMPMVQWLYQQILNIRRVN